MSMNFKHHVIQYEIDIVTSCGKKMIESEKEKKKVSGKYKWETISVIPIMPLVGVNHHQPILHMSKRMVHCYYTDETIIQFSIGFMINPSFNCNNLFRVRDPW